MTHADLKGSPEEHERNAASAGQLEHKLRLPFESRPVQTVFEAKRLHAEPVLKENDLPWRACVQAKAVKACKDIPRVLYECTNVNNGPCYHPSIHQLLVPDRRLHTRSELSIWDTALVKHLAMVVRSTRLLPGSIHLHTCRLAQLACVPGDYSGL